MRELERKLKNCAKLCYDDDNAPKIPRYKLEKNEISDSILPQFRNTPQSPPHGKEEDMEIQMQIPGYNIISKLGQGGMGAVYKAIQKSMQRTVAIKVLSKQQQQKDHVKRFIREARSVAKLNHKNIITGIDVGANNNFYYFIMEYIEGQNVAQILRDGKLPLHKSLDIVIQIAEALRYADEQHKIIHRDIKPENIMIRSEDAHVKLCDLGLARRTNISSMTAEGRIMGTPHYMSPEQCRGENDIDKRSDIYSLGITFFHMVTGVRPFNAAHPAAICLKHVSEKLPNPKKYNNNLPHSLYALLLKMSAKEKKDRFQNYEQLIEALQTFRSSRYTKTVTNVTQPIDERIATKKIAQTSRIRTMRIQQPPKKKLSATWGIGVAVAIIAVIVMSQFSGVDIPQIERQISQQVTENNLQQALQIASEHSSYPQISELRDYIEESISLRNHSQDEKNDTQLLAIIEQNQGKGPSWYNDILKDVKKHIDKRRDKKLHDAQIAKNKLRANIEKNIYEAVQIADIHKLHDMLEKVQEQQLSTKWGNSFSEQESLLWQMIVEQITYLEQQKNSNPKISLLKILQGDFSVIAQEIAEKKLARLGEEKQDDWEKHQPELQKLVAQNEYRQAGECLAKLCQQEATRKNAVDFIEEIFANIPKNPQLSRDDNAKVAINKFADFIHFYAQIASFLPPEHSGHTQVLQAFQKLNDTLYSFAKNDAALNLAAVLFLHEKTMDELPLTNQEKWAAIISQNLHKYIDLNLRPDDLAKMTELIEKHSDFIGEKVQDKHREAAKERFRDLMENMLNTLEKSMFWEIKRQYNALQKFHQLDELEFAATDSKIIDKIKAVSQQLIAAGHLDAARSYYDGLGKEFPQDSEIVREIDELKQQLQQQDNPENHDEKVRKVFAGKVKNFSGNWVEINYPFFRSQDLELPKMEKDWHLFKYGKTFKPTKLKMYSPKFMLLKKGEVALWKYPLKPNYFHIKAHVVNPQNRETRKEFSKIVDNTPSKIGKNFGVVLFYRPGKSYYLILYNVRDRRNHLYIVSKNGKERLLRKSEGDFVYHKKPYEIWVQYKGEEQELQFNCGDAHVTYNIGKDDVEAEGFLGIVALDWLATWNIEINGNLHMDQFPLDRKIHLKKQKK